MRMVRNEEPLSTEELVAKEKLEAKMAEWESASTEVSEEGGEVFDGFDLGLWIAFPFIVFASLLFFVFPFIMDSIDVSSVGPPPTV